MEVFSLSMSLSSQNILFCVCLCVSSLLIRTPIQYNFILYLTKSSKTPCPNKFTFTEPEVRASAELSEVYNSSHSTAVPYLGGLCIIINRIWANFEYTWYTKINYSILILFLALVVSWNHCIVLCVPLPSLSTVSQIPTALPSATSVSISPTQCDFQVLSGSSLCPIQLKILFQTVAWKTRRNLFTSR